MAQQNAPGNDRALEQSRAILLELFGGCSPRPFAIRFWDGTSWDAETGHDPRFTLVLQHPGALRRMLWAASELTVSEAYLYDDVDVEGDIGELFAVAEQLLDLRVSRADRLRYAWALIGLPRDAKPRTGRQAAHLYGALHSKERDSEAIAYHYNVPSDFFALWLDRRMVYSCAYFESSDVGLDDAQEQKLDYICRKLRLRPGQRFLDIGCGWGGLVIHAASRYGVDALGVTLSQPQADLANQRIAQAGLSAHCRVEVRDYRDLDDANLFDRMASVGMFEHVGERLLPEYFRRAWKLLRPGGLFLNHGIAFTQPRPMPRGPTFFDRYVFPDGELVTLSSMLRAAETSAFEVRDVESLREHYRLTLRHWISRLEDRRDEVRRIVDEVTYRVWRLYMAAAAHQFATGRTTLYQTLLCKPDCGAAGLPLTRSDWYTGHRDDQSSSPSSCRASFKSGVSRPSMNEP